ncbi:MAG: glutamate-cysteine ligase family protein [Candidatus Gastranaerophilales bacterium]|nr:glutamate-cysteine ligase family protein [Candidatus Gastranaerophilales bacterium]
MQNTLKSEIEKILALPVTKREIEEYYRSNCKKGELKVGLEYERVSLDSRAYEPAEYRCLSEIIRNFALMNEWELVIDSNIIIGAKDNFSSISLEPGGQFEISLEPKSSLDDILENLNHYTRQLDKLGEFYNITFLPYGINPKTTYPDINIIKKKRYEIMADYLPKTGKLAPVMMRETAGVQANFDYVSEDDAILKLKTAAYMSPFVTGFYANSPIRGGELTKYKSFRALAWKYTGYDRCNLFYSNLINSRMGQGFEDYINAIINVPMLYIQRNGRNIELEGKITFKDFMQRGYMNYTATLEDYILHSSLTFPDVRLKNCIEIRNHDSQNISNALSVCALYKGILHNKEATAEVINLLKPLRHEDLEVSGLNSAKYGLNYMVNKLNMGAYDVARKIFEISRKYLPDNEKDYLDGPLWLLQNRKCVADIILEKGIRDTSSLCEYLKTVS